MLICGIAIDSLLNYDRNYTKWKLLNDFWAKLSKGKLPVALCTEIVLGGIAIELWMKIFLGRNCLNYLLPLRIEIVIGRISLLT